MELFGLKINFFTSSGLAEGAKVYFYVSGIPVTDTFVSALVMVTIFSLFCIYLTRNLSLIPGKKQYIAEGFYYAAEYLGEISLGKAHTKYIYFLGTLFFYVLFANVVAFLPIPLITYSNGEVVVEPLLRTPTSDLNATISLALIATFYVIYSSIASQGIGGYLKSFIDPLPFMLPLNVMGELTKPLSLSMRLFGNMLSGGIMMSLVYKYLPIFVPAPLHLYFDIFSGVLQSFIFVMLTAVNISFGIADEDSG